MITEYDVEAFTRKLYSVGEGFERIAARVGPRRSSVTFRPVGEAEGWAKFTLNTGPIQRWLDEGTDDIIEAMRINLAREGAGA